MLVKVVKGGSEGPAGGQSDIRVPNALDIVDYPILTVQQVMEPSLRCFAALIRVDFSPPNIKALFRAVTL